PRVPDRTALGEADQDRLHAGAAVAGRHVPLLVRPAERDAAEDILARTVAGGAGAVGDAAEIGPLADARRPLERREALRPTRVRRAGIRPRAGFRSRLPARRPP